MASIRMRYLISVAVLLLCKLEHPLSKIGSDRFFFPLLNKRSRALAAPEKHQTSEPANHKV